MFLGITLCGIDFCGIEVQSCFRLTLENGPILHISCPELHSLVQLSFYNTAAAIPPATANANAGNGAAVIIAFDFDEDPDDDVDPWAVDADCCVVAELVVPELGFAEVALDPPDPLPDRVAAVAEPVMLPDPCGPAAV